MAKYFDTARIPPGTKQYTGSRGEYYIDPDGDIHLVDAVGEIFYVGHQHRMHLIDPDIQTDLNRAAMASVRNQLGQQSSQKKTNLPAPKSTPPSPKTSSSGGGGKPPSNTAPYGVMDDDQWYPRPKKRAPSRQSLTMDLEDTYGVQQPPQDPPTLQRGPAPPSRPSHLPLPQGSPPDSIQSTNLEIGRIRGADDFSKYLTGVGANNLRGAMEGDPTAIINAAIEKITAFFDSTGKALSSSRGGDMLSGVGGMMQHGGDMTMNPVLSTFGFLVKVVGDSVEVVRKWNQQLYEANIKFKDFSGGMASVAANQEVRDILLSMERGERRAGTAEYQAVGKHELEKTFSKWEDLGANLQNILSGTLAQSLNLILKPLNPVVDKMNQALDEWMRKMGYADDQTTAWLAEGANRMKELANAARPVRFPPVP